MFNFFNLNSFNLNDKLVGVRIDINSHLVSGKLVVDERVKKSIETIKAVKKKGAKIVILAHIGRFGQKDCLSLKAHFELFSKLLNCKITFLKEISYEKNKKHFSKLKRCEILMFENLRFLKCEENFVLKKNSITDIISNFDYYVLDSFSVAHRKHSSIVGSCKTTTISGPLFELELNNLNKLENIKSPKFFLLGGAKPCDLYPLLEFSFEKKKVDFVFLTGIISEIVLIIKGFDLGAKFDFLKQKGFLNDKIRLVKILKKYSKKIILPNSLAYKIKGKRYDFELKDIEKHRENLKKNLIGDIGISTVKNYEKLILDANYIYIKGPCGKFDEKNFEFGTKNLYTKIANSKIFSVIGGGESSTVCLKYGLLKKISYESLAGGALAHYFAGEKLVGIEKLQKSFSDFQKQESEILVVGSNVIDTEVKLNKSLKDLKLGEKIKIEEPFCETIGGGGINASLTFSKFKAKVFYLGALSFENETKIKNYLKSKKISSFCQKPILKSQARSIILDIENKDRTIFTYRGQNSEFTLQKDFIKKIKIRNFYFTTLGGKSLSCCINFAKEIKKNFATYFLAYNPSSYLIKSQRKEVVNLVKFSSVLIVNFEEAKLLSGKNKILDCLKFLKNLVGEVVVITNGGRGAYAYDGIENYFQKSFDVKVVDTTGAGDVFGATFVYFYLRGFGILRALLCASLNSSSVISDFGVENGILREKEILEKCF